MSSLLKTVIRQGAGFIALHFTAHTEGSDWLTRRVLQFIAVK